MFMEKRNEEEELSSLITIYDNIIKETKVYLNELKEQDNYKSLQNSTFETIFNFLLESEYCKQLIEQFGF
jgi:hypothetical protein